MAINEIFPNPTVKEVVFQIRFPNAFFIESKIGEFQLSIMKEFPNSAMLYRKQIVIADIGPDIKQESIPKNFEDSKGTKIWRFESPKKYMMNVTTDSLDITSQFHKTYKLGTENRFRDIIELVVNNFLNIVKLPIINRIGIRYIDECPINKKTNRSFLKYYNTTFPLKRFSLDDSLEMQFFTVTIKYEYPLRFSEKIAKVDNQYKLILDYDSYAESIDPHTYLDITDKLHDIILKEYENSIKPPVIDFMRSKKR